LSWEIERFVELCNGCGNVASPKNLDWRMTVHFGRPRVTKREYVRLRWRGLVWSQPIDRARSSSIPILTIFHSDASPHHQLNLSAKEARVFAM
jgi:hypothetical protein